MQRWTSIAMLAVGMTWAGCCGPCDQTSLGDFALQPGSRAWFDFANGSSQVFEGSDGRRLVLIYRALTRSTTARQENCEDRGSCGLCCDKFTTEVVETGLVSPTNNLRFEFVMEKDFITNDVREVNGGAVSDWFVMSLNGRLSCEVFGLPDTAITGSVELNSRLFTGVITCEIDPQAADVETAQVFRYYFQKGIGIVGFEETNGQVWSLE
jgi:hypothetical protein